MKWSRPSAGRKRRRRASGSSNDRLARSSARAQYLSGIVQPLMVFVANLNYIAVAVVGALQVTAGAMTIGGIQAFIQFTRLFSQPVGQIGGMLTLMQSCLASAERVFELLDAPEIPPDSACRPFGQRRRQASRRPAKNPCPAQIPNGRKSRARHAQAADPDAAAGSRSSTSASATAPARPW